MSRNDSNLYITIFCIAIVIILELISLHSYFGTEEREDGVRISETHDYRRLAEAGGFFILDGLAP